MLRCTGKIYIDGDNRYIVAQPQTEIKKNQHHTHL
jgi:hypothetical protein